MEKIDVEIAEILTDFLLIGNAAQTATKLKELFGFENLLPVDERRNIFNRQVFAWNFKNKEKYSKEVLTSFISLWGRMEDTKNMKFELEKNFKIGGRLATFTSMGVKIGNSNKIKNFKNFIGGLDPLR